MDKISALMGLNLFFFETNSIALSELADMPFEFNSLNLLHILMASAGFFLTLSKRFDWLNKGLILKNDRNKNKKRFFIILGIF